MFQNLAKVFEHELYNHFVYNERHSFFHDFEGEVRWIFHIQLETFYLEITYIFQLEI